MQYWSYWVIIRRCDHMLRNARVRSHSEYALPGSLAGMSGKFEFLSTTTAKECEYLYCQNLIHSYFSVPRVIVCWCSVRSQWCSTFLRCFYGNKATPTSPNGRPDTRHCEVSWCSLCSWQEYMCVEWSPSFLCSIKGYQYSRASYKVPIGSNCPGNSTLPYGPAVPYLFHCCLSRKWKIGL